ncbi:uncharacterized protein [Notamacropus eugenii]|uniref:uncharacterized protein n=1 Tax=Notamacropus eugenii TaxID=9315 RepID=UPI003B67E209
MTNQLELEVALRIYTGLSFQKQNQSLKSRVNESSLEKCKLFSEASAISCREKATYRRPTDFTLNLNHPFQSLPVTKTLSGSTYSAVSRLQDDESTGAGSGPENEYRPVIPEAKPVPQKQHELELPRKMEDECAISCQKKNSYRRPKDFTLNLNNPHQSLPVSPMLKHEAAGAGSSSENVWRVAIPGAKQVLQKQGKPQLPVIIEGKQTHKESCTVNIMNFSCVDNFLKFLPSKLY